eukprot:m.201212 g.201212  ORF g.201212 m.201212 type:complete len:105 (-) comp10673_c0_seq2:224-538(-)
MWPYKPHLRVDASVCRSQTTHAMHYCHTRTTVMLMVHPGSTASLAFNLLYPATSDSYPWAFLLLIPLGATIVQVLLVFYYRGTPAEKTVLPVDESVKLLQESDH